LAKGIVPAIALTLGKVILDALFSAVDYVLDKVFPNRQKLDSKRLMERGLIEKLRDFFLSDEDFKQKYAPPKVQKQSFIQDSKEAVEAFRKAAFNPADIRIYIVPATYSGGVQNAAYGGVSTGYGSGAGGSPTALFNSLPGGKLPNFGVGSGGIIRRDNIPSFSGGGGSAGGLSKSAFERTFADTPLAGKYDQVVAAAKANGIDPAPLAGVMAHETGRGRVLSGNNPGGVMDPATGWSRKMQFGDLEAGINKTAQAVAKNYRRAGGDLDKMGSLYAPRGAANDPGGLNDGWPSGVRKQMNGMSGASVGSAGSGDAVGIASKFIGMNEYSDTKVLAGYLGADVRGRSSAWCARFVNKALETAGGKGTGSAVANSFQRWGSAVNPSDVKRDDVLLQTHGYGYNQTGGHVGLATGQTRMVNGRLHVKMLTGNNGDSVRERWIDVDNNLMVRRGNLPQGITSQVPAQDAIKNVPASVPPAIGGGDARMPPSR
jgi:hypothetical protein